MPQETLVSDGVAIAGGYTVIPAVLLPPRAEAVIVTLTDWFTAEDTILNVAELAPVGICTDAGTCSALLLLFRSTVMLLLVTPLRLTEQDFD